MPARVSPGPAMSDRCRRSGSRPAPRRGRRLAKHYRPRNSLVVEVASTAGRCARAWSLGAGCRRKGPGRAARIDPRASSRQEGVTDMCDVVGKAYKVGLSRRGFLSRTGAAAGALAGATLLNSAPAGAHGKKPATSGKGPAPVSVGQPLKGYRTKVVLLGTAGGPVWWTGTDRKGISTAVAVGERVYLVDCGEGFGHRFRQTDLAPSGPGSQARTLNRLQGVFLTHLHSDHVVDYNSIPLFGLFSGLQQPRPQPVHAYGPGNRGRLPDVLPPGRPAPPVINPANPTPGTVEMTDYLYQAFATDLNDRMRDSGSPDLRTRFRRTTSRFPPAPTIRRGTRRPASRRFSCTKTTTSASPQRSSTTARSSRPSATASTPKTDRLLSRATPRRRRT